MEDEADDQALTDIPAQQQVLPGKDTDMDPTAEWTRLECWDNDGKPFLKEVGVRGTAMGGRLMCSTSDRESWKVKLPSSLEEIQVSDDLPLKCSRGKERTSPLSISPKKRKSERDLVEGIMRWVAYDSAQNVKKAIEKDGGKCLTLALDLMQADNAKKVVDEHLKAYGRLDILVNNASKQIMCKQVEDIELENVESTFRSNILGMFALTKWVDESSDSECRLMVRYAVPHLKAGASIINTTSVTAWKGSPSMLDYSSTKGAIVTFTRSLAMQLAPKHIRVNAGMSHCVNCCCCI